MNQHQPQLALILPLSLCISCSLMIDSEPVGLKAAQEARGPLTEPAGGHELIPDGSAQEQARLLDHTPDASPAPPTGGSPMIAGTDLPEGGGLAGQMEGGWDVPSAGVSVGSSAGTTSMPPNDLPPEAGEEPQAGEEPSCLPRTELCNQQDDDCDLSIDEGFEELGEPCMIGVGACSVMGSLGCGLSGVDLTCIGAPLPPSDELCDAIDNDCDGVIDEDVEGCCTEGDVRACGIGVGQCTLGEQRCVSERWDPCDGGSPQLEVCDGEDNDCDGLSDEGTLNACGQCGPVPNESCNGADDDCDGQADEGVTNACGQCGPVPNESCNGADDDCDGQVDEGFPQLGSSCEVGVGACANTGTVVCDGPSGVTCSATPGSPSAADVCNDVDDDCDGLVDEETNKNTDVNNCGSCGYRCGTLGNRCVNGDCYCGASVACCTGAPIRAICVANTACQNEQCVGQCGGRNCK